MRFLVIVRYGEHSQMLALGEKLKSLLGNASRVILSSSAPYVRESAAVLASIFSVQFQERDELWCDGAHLCNFLKVHELVCSLKDTVEAVILVTHLDYCRVYASFFARKEFEVYLPSGKIGEGKAWVVDVNAQILFPLE